MYGFLGIETTGSTERQSLEVYPKTVTCCVQKYKRRNRTELTLRTKHNGNKSQTVFSLCSYQIHSYSFQDYASLFLFSIFIFLYC